MVAEPQWKTVSEGEEEEESKIVFDAIGDEFVGTYLGNRKIEPRDITESGYTQARFRGTDDFLYFTNLGYSLKKGLSNVRPGSLVRVTFVSELDTGQASPMKQFKVEVASARVTPTRDPENS